MLGYVSVRWLKDLFNKVLVEEKIPNEWWKSVMVPIFKGKGTYRNVKIIKA